MIRILWWAGVAFIIYWVIRDPLQAAAAFRGAGSIIAAAARGLSAFMGHL